MVNGGIEKKVNTDIPDFFNPDITEIDFQGVSVFERNETILDSKIFGVPLKFIAVFGFIYWLIK